jgi:hypothetical protein
MTGAVPDTPDSAARAPGAELASTAEAYLVELAGAELRALRARYNLAQSIRGAYQEHGPRIIAQVSATLCGVGLRFDCSVVRKLHRVAGVIRPAEFEDLLRLQFPSGLPLKWSHLELLSCLHSRQQRSAAARQIVVASDARAAAVRRSVSKARHGAADAYGNVNSGQLHDGADGGTRLVK